MTALRRGLMALLLVPVLLLTGCGVFGGGDAEGPHEIAGGFPSGIYYGYGQELATAMGEGGVEITVVETDGSVENLRRVGGGESLLGFAQADTAADAVAGEGAFDQPMPIRAAARLYDEYVHVLVHADAEIDSLEDFAGRRVSLGAEDSGVSVVASRVLEAAGVTVDDVDDAELGLDGAISAMRRGTIEGFFWVGGVPTPGLDRLTETTPIRLIPIETAIAEEINAAHGGVYRTAEFPVGVYERTSPTPTITVPNLLIASEAAPDAVVEAALETLFASRMQMAQTVPAAALLDLRQAIYTMPIELHPGAVDYYRQTRR